MCEPIRHDVARTLSILRALAKGKRLTLDYQWVLCMGEDMSVGFEMAGGVVSELTLSQLNATLDRYEIGMAIPE